MKIRKVTMNDCFMAAGRRKKEKCRIFIDSLLNFDMLVGSNGDISMKNSSYDMDFSLPAGFRQMKMDKIYENEMNCLTIEGRLI